MAGLSPRALESSGFSAKGESNTGRKRWGLHCASQSWRSHCSLALPLLLILSLSWLSSQAKKIQIKDIRRHHITLQMTGSKYSGDQTLIPIPMCNLCRGMGCAVYSLLWVLGTTKQAAYSWDIGPCFPNTLTLCTAVLEPMHPALSPLLTFAYLAQI